MHVFMMPKYQCEEYGAYTNLIKRYPHVEMFGVCFTIQPKSIY